MKGAGKAETRNSKREPELGDVLLAEEGAEPGGDGG